jgi:hypothetical protein
VRINLKLVGVVSGIGMNDETAVRIAVDRHAPLRNGEVNTQDISAATEYGGAGLPIRRRGATHHSDRC